MGFGSKKTIAYLLMFLFAWLAALSVFAEERKEAEPEEKPLFHSGQWEFDAGGQVRLRGDFGKNQNFTDFAFTPGTGKHSSSRGHAFRDPLKTVLCI